MTSSPRDELVLFWRPGCPFCWALRRRLDKRRIRYQSINIWSDPGAAAVVRRAADGNETVPTVAVGPKLLVNPGIDEVLAVAAEHAPGAVPDDEPRPRRGWFRRRRPADPAGD